MDCRDRQGASEIGLCSPLTQASSDEELWCPACGHPAAACPVCCPHCTEQRRLNRAARECNPGYLARRVARDSAGLVRLFRLRVRQSRAFRLAFLRRVWRGRRAVTARLRVVSRFRGAGSPGAVEALVGLGVCLRVDLLPADAPPAQCEVALQCMYSR